MSRSAALAPFDWAPFYETGFAEVDHQHHRLVDLVNVLARRAASGEAIQPAELAHVLDVLGRYALHHFTTEEALMAQVGLDPRHVDVHRQTHADFVTQVTLMQHSSDPAEVVPVLYTFVTSWLTFHILDIDQSMARQLRAVAAGMSPADAFEADAGHGSDPGNTALVVAVRRLLAVVAERNQALARINLGLEERVASRTRELTEANQTLRHTLATLQETETRLREADKLAAVGQLAAGVAHEINNPLGFVASNLGALRDYTERLLALVDTADRLLAGAGHREAWEAARAGSDLDFIREELPGLVAESGRGLERVGEIVHALQDFASPRSREQAESPLAPLLEAAIQATAGGRRPDQQVQRDYAALPPLLLNPTLIGEVFKALLDNADRALGQAAGTISVRTRLQGGEACVEVADSGCGMDEATRARLFEPFFTTRPVGEGRGLGLSCAYRIIAQHRGRIEVDSALGQGSCFRIWLPVKVAA